MTRSKNFPFVTGSRLSYSLAATLLFAIALTCAQAAEPPIPPPVTDEAAMLSDKQRDEINALLSAHNGKGTGRITVLIVEKLPPGMTIDKLASVRINQPPLKANEKADRVLLAIALQDRKMRIETSQQVWTLLPDAFCKTVIDKTIAPQFKEKKYFEGIRAGISELIRKLNSG